MLFQAKEAFVVTYDRLVPHTPAAAHLAARVAKARFDEYPGYLGAFPLHFGLTELGADVLTDEQEGIRWAFPSAAAMRVTLGGGILGAEEVDFATETLYLFDRLQDHNGNTIGARYAVRGTSQPIAIVVDKGPGVGPVVRAHAKGIAFDARVFDLTIAIDVVDPDDEVDKGWRGEGFDPAGGEE